MANLVDPGYTSAFTVTPTDDLPINYRALWIGVGGTLSFHDAATGAFNATTVPAGLFPVAVREVRAASTAAQILGLN